MALGITGNAVRGVFFPEGEDGGEKKINVHEFNHSRVFDTSA